MITTTKRGMPDSPATRVRRTEGLAVSLLAISGIAIGIGIGIRWVAAGAVTWESMAGLATLAGSLILMVWALRRATCGMKRVPRMLAGSLMIVAASVLVWTLTPAVIATQVPPTSHSTAGLGLGGREVRFDTSDGVRLWGWYVPPPEGRVVVLRHGAGSTASDIRQQASVLVENGYGVLMTDARGHGLSEGTAMDFGWHGDDDIAAAVIFLTQQPEVDDKKIAVMGMSMGGEEAIGAMAADQRIRAVVAEGATARTYSDKVWLEDEFGWRGWIQVRLEWLQYTATDLLTRAVKPESLASAARRASPRPILLIAGAKSPDESRAAEFIGADTDNVTIWTVPNAGHIQGVTVAREDWENRVVRFLDDALEGNR